MNNEEKEGTKSMEKKLYWYAICAPGARERTAKKLILAMVRNLGLRERITAVEIPTYTASGNTGGAGKIKEIKRFPGYVFVEMEDSAELRSLVSRAAGGLRFVGLGGGSAKPLTDKEAKDCGLSGMDTAA